MNQERLSFVLGTGVPKIIELIVKNENIGELDATKKFYNSQVYRFLENEETKVWHLSPMTLYNMYEDEIKTGKITFPEEA